jgi:hypothetical protein
LQEKYLTSVAAAAAAPDKLVLPLVLLLKHSTGQLLQA